MTEPPDAQRSKIGDDTHNAPSEGLRSGSLSRRQADIGFAQFKRLAEMVFSKSSKTDTAARLIDPIFVECLGWREGDIARERNMQTGCIDYTFSIGGYKKFILGAKEVGHEFEISKSLTDRRYAIRGTITTDDRTKAAIERVQRYCNEKGVLFAVITNGRQYLLFQAFKLNQDWRSGRCIVFHSIQDIEKNFMLFWSILSRHSVEEGSLKRYISDQMSTTVFQIPLALVQAKDAVLRRNNLGPSLEPILEYAFSGLVESWQLEVLRSCYVRKKDFDDAGIQLGRHFDRPPEFAKKYHVQSIFEMPGAQHTFQEAYDHSQYFLRTSDQQGALMLLMGGIGCGKTTFLHHFFNFVVGLRKETLWFYVDFRNAPPDPTLIETYIYRSIIDELDTRHAERLHDLRYKLEKLFMGPLRPEKKDITILFSELMLSGFTISLVLDNSDQHAHVNPHYQEYLLQLAKSLTSTLRTITVVTLREESFYRSLISGILDASVPLTFHLASPNFEDVARSRIRFVQRVLAMKDQEISKMIRSKFTGDKQVLIQFFTIVEDSLRSSRQTGVRILEFINQVSGGNMRTALDFFRTFLISGNTDVAEMLRLDIEMRKNNRGGYQIPFHHVIKSIILENSRLYSSDHSRVMNLFDLNPEYNISHFLHLRILKFLSERTSYKTNHGPGYVEIQSIMQYAEEISISNLAITWSLTQLAYFGLVQFENQSNRGYDNASYVRITDTGLYYLNELVRRFVYIDLMWIDTPIADSVTVKELLRKLVELEPSKTTWHLEERLRRSETFIRYLSEMEESEFGENPEYRESALAKTAFMPGIWQEFKREKEYIESRRFR